MFKGFKNKKEAKLAEAKENHSKFINQVIDYLKTSGFSLHDAQIVAQIAEIASRGSTFEPLLTAAQEATTKLLETKLHPIDALLASQLMALIMKNENPQRIVDGAKELSTLYTATGFQQNLFSTDMAILAQRVQEAMDKMSMQDVQIENKI